MNETTHGVDRNLTNYADAGLAAIYVALFWLQLVMTGGI